METLGFANYIYLVTLSTWAIVFANKTDRAEPCIFLGLSEDTEGHYLIYSTKTNRWKL